MARVRCQCCSSCVQATPRRQRPVCHVCDIPNKPLQCCYRQFQAYLSCQPPAALHIVATIIATPVATVAVETATVRVSGDSKNASTCNFRRLRPSWPSLGSCRLPTWNDTSVTLPNMSWTPRVATSKPHQSRKPSYASVTSFEAVSADILTNSSLVLPLSAFEKFGSHFCSLRFVSLWA